MTNPLIPTTKRSDDSQPSRDDVVHLVRFVLTGDLENARRQALRLSRRHQLPIPPTSEARIVSPRLSSEFDNLPTDSETGAPLLAELLPDPAEAVLESDVSEAIENLAREWERREALVAHGLRPTQTLLFVGPPGVGKTMTASQIGERLGLRVFVVDLGSVMNSLLGKTGQNLGAVLDFANRHRCLLLIDEVDALAKYRSDREDVGELKRLVTVLLQRFDRWGNESLLIAATNHPELLDRAIWRRFDAIVRFDLPTEALRQRFLAAQLPTVSRLTRETVAAVTRDASFSDLSNLCRDALRYSVINETPLETALLDRVSTFAKRSSTENAVRLATELVRAGYSQRRAAEKTGVARDTIRKRLREADNGAGR